MKNELIGDLNRIVSRLSRPQLTVWIDSDALKILESKYDSVNFSELVYYLHGNVALVLNIRIIFLNTFHISELHKLATERDLPLLDANYMYSSLVDFVKLFNFSLNWKEEVKNEYIDIGCTCPTYGAKIVSMGCPHYYQKSIKDYCISWYLDKQDFQRALISMPTGSGKTRTANEFLIDLFRINKAKKVLWLAHRRELLYQTAKAFEQLHLEKGDDCINIGFNFDTRNHWFDHSNSKQIIYSSYEKISASLAVLDFRIDLLVIDEAHYTTASTYEPKVKNILNSNNARLLGLTATPMRANDDIFLNLLSYYQYTISLSEVLGSNDPIKILQDQGYLAQVEYDYLNIPLDEFSEDSRVLNDAVVNKCRLFQELGQNILIFAMSRAHSIALNAMLNIEGIESACIIGETPFSERANIMEQFRNKKITAIVNFDILTTGVDIPGMNGILVLRKFNERHTAIQVLGRALRGTKNGGNEKNTVIFINEVYKQNINDLYNY
jgi:superfamily II DNA or RNA helicase